MSDPVPYWYKKTKICYNSMGNTRGNLGSQPVKHVIIEQIGPVVSQQNKYLPQPGPYIPPQPQLELSSSSMSDSRSWSRTAPLNLPSDPKLVICPSCNTEATTETHYETGRLTWLLFIIMFFCW